MKTKHRILSLLLIMILLLTAFPAALLTGSAAETGKTSASDYNDLYVKTGLQFQLDFYSLNAIWDPDGTALEAAKTATSQMTGSHYIINRPDLANCWFNTYRSVGTWVMYSGGTGAGFAVNAGYITPDNTQTASYIAMDYRGGTALADLGVEVVFQPNTTACNSPSPFRFQEVFVVCSTTDNVFHVTSVRDAIDQSFVGVSMPADKVGTLAYHAIQDETDATAFTYGAATNGAAYSTITGTDTALSATAFIGHGATSNMNLYAVRYYDHALTDAERAQNHFADVAKYFRLNLMVKSFVGFSEAQMKEIYASVADITLDSTRGEAQMAYYQVLSAMPYELLSLAGFDGYAVRLSSDIPGIRAVFNFDMDAVCAYAQKYGVSVELGVSVSGSSTVEKIAVTVNADGSVASDSLYYEPESADGYSSFVLALLYREGTDGTPIAEMNPTDRKAMLNAEVTYQGFVKVTKADETPTVYSLDMTSSFGDAVSAAEVYTRFATESDVAEDSLVRQVADWLN